jgi:hypothetical protein
MVRSIRPRLPGHKRHRKTKRKMKPVLIVLLSFASGASAQDTTAVSQEILRLRPMLHAVTAAVDSLTIVQGRLATRLDSLDTILSASRLAGKQFVGTILHRVSYRGGDDSRLIKGEQVELLGWVPGDRPLLEFRHPDGRTGFVQAINVEWDEEDLESLKALGAKGVREREEQARIGRLREVAAAASLTERRNARQEARRQEELDRIAALKDRNIPVYLKDVWFDIDSAGGVGPAYSVVSISAKEIAYVSLTVEAHNAVGDAVQGRVDGQMTHVLSGVGPIPGFGHARFDWSDHPAFYARTTACLEIHKIEIEFLDGTGYTAVDDLKPIWELRDYFDDAFTERVKPRNECGVIR